MICQNVNCKLISEIRKPSLPVQELSTCNFCKMKTYCCKACMHEDWINGHSKECQCKKHEEDLKSTEQIYKYITKGTLISINDAKTIVSQGISALKKYEKVMVPGKMDNILGEGSFGKVCLIRSTETKEYYAMKVVEKKSTLTESALKLLTAEVEIHKRLVHENIIRLQEFIDDGKKLYIVMEYAKGGNLFRAIRKKGKFTENEAFFYFKQICNAVYFLHKNKIMHRDIKPENLLLGEKNILKLCDFGSCTEIEGERRTYCGTAEYLAPEIIKKDGYTEKVDIWSLGVLLYEMLQGHAPHKGRSEIEILGKILHSKIVFDVNLNDDAKKFILALMAEDPKQRPTIVQAINFPWMLKFAKEINLPSKSLIKKEENVNMTQLRGKWQSAQFRNLLEEDTSTNGSMSRENTLNKTIQFANQSTNVINEVPRHILYGFPEYVPRRSKIERVVIQKPSTGSKPKVSLKKSNIEKPFWENILPFGDKL